MDKPEWMPVNPCATCGVEFRHCPLQPNTCKEYIAYHASISYQLKLLDYLIEHYEGSDRKLVPDLQQMKSQLEKER